MDTYRCFMFLLLALSYQVKVVHHLIIPETQKLDYFHKYDKVLVTLLNDNEFNLRNVIIFDNSSSSPTVNALSTLSKSIGITLKSKSEFDQEYTSKRKDPIEIEGAILIMNDAKEWFIFYENLSYFWNLNNKCVIFIIAKVHYACLNSVAVMQDMAKSNFAKSFFVCMEPKLSEPVIYSHDLYGDTKPLNWLKIHQSTVMLYNWTLYGRIISENETYNGFHFNRTDILKDPRVMMYVSKEKENIEERRFLYKGDARNLHGIDYIDEMIAFERILNMSFVYDVHFFQVGTYNRNRPLVTFRQTDVSVMIQDMVGSSLLRTRTLSYPTYYDHFIILSQARNPATPLEKIADFYGIWTLVSLLLILIFTIIVIWFKAKKQLAPALFDCLRLLINSGIATPINTLPLKIFFSMIFLYFIVIHSTFSGQLSKFLTVPTYLGNIDSLDDLTQPRVKTVHSYFFTLNDELSNYETIAKKYVSHETASVCFQLVMKYPNDVCIGVYWSFLRTIFHRNLTGYHISKHKIAPVVGRMQYLKRFPLIEKFDWALMALSETRIYHRRSTSENEKIIQKLNRIDAKKQIDFRPISYSDLKFAFVLLIIGNSISLILFFIELLTFHYEKIIKKIQGSWQMVKNRKKFGRRRFRTIQVQPII